MLTFIALLLLTAPPPPVCTPIPGAEPVLRPGVVILLGEIHGTREGPVAVSSLTCLALEKKHRATVALEIPSAEQPSLDAFLAGDDAALLDGEFWKREYQDGRSSTAMMELLSTLRSYRELDDGLRIVAIDDPDSDDGRDAAMARGLNHILSEAPERWVVVLTGNVHNRLSRGIRWDADFEPMGYRLKQLSPPVELVSLQLTHAGGTAWVCTGESAEDCGVREIGGVENVPLGINLFVEPTDQPFTGAYHLGNVTASPPAVARPRSEVPRLDSFSSGNASLASPEVPASSQETPLACRESLSPPDVDAAAMDGNVWTGTLDDWAGFEDAPLGVGRLRVTSERIWDWWVRAKLPLFDTPDGRLWGWYVGGWLVQSAGVSSPPRVVGTEGMWETEYEQLSFVVLERRSDGWLRFRYGRPHAEPGGNRDGTAWIHACHLEALAFESWEDRLLSDEISPLYFRTEVPHALRESPEAASSRLRWISGDYHLVPLEVRGSWMRVRALFPSDYCAGDDIEVETREGWIQWRSADKGPWVWYYTRGC